MTDIEIIRHELEDIKDRVEKLEQQFTWPCNLSSDWNYVKDHQWEQGPFKSDEEAINYLRKYKDTSVSKRPL